MEELSDLRAQLDGIDREMVALFEKRMEISRKVAETKKAKGLPVLDQSREEQVLLSRCGYLTDKTLTAETRALYQEIMRLSRGVQEKLLKED
jgi:monofunctional chorismate mutase